MLETWIQKKIINYLEKKEWFEVIKLIKLNKNWYPDLQVLIWNWRHFWIEVKQVKWEESILQAFVRNKLIKKWDISLVCYWYDDFLRQYKQIAL